MAFNPFDTVTLPKKTNFKPNILSEKEFCNLISAVSDTYDEIVILLAGVAGLRRSEIFALRWTDINFDKCQITIKKAMVRFRKYVEKDPKSEASKRTIYAPAFVFDKLKAYRASLKVVDEYVCSKYKADSYSKHFKKLTSKLGINDIRLHDLRHFNAIMMMRSGVPDKVAARRGGWSQVATLREIYQHSTDEADRQASERLGTALNLTDILTDMKNTMP
jgi:integrase